MTFFSVFAGIGGGDLGLQRAGWQCVGQCEIDCYCQKVLKKHWPEIWKWKDVKTLTGKTIEENCGAVDLLAGGPPCQPASLAGQRKGSADDRWLWPEFLRLVSEIQPMWVLAENPRGVTSLRVEGLQFTEWLAREFEARGYELLPIELAAEDVGAPHRRERIFFVGRLANAEQYNHRSEIKRGEVIGPNSARPASWLSGSSVGIVANTSCAQRWANSEGRFDDDDGADAGWEETPSGFELCGEQLADATRFAEREPEHGQCAIARERTREEFGGRSNGAANDLADSESNYLGDDRFAGAASASIKRRASGERSRSLQAGTDRSLARCRWPARPGHCQYEWEEPRTIEQSVTGFSIQVLDADSGDRRSIAHLGSAAKKILKSGLGESVAGISVRLAGRHRVAALKALGNAIVPQVMEVLGRAIINSQL